MHFDPRTAKTLPPGAHMVIDGCQGLRLVASATRKTWTYRYKDDSGKMKQIAIGRWPAMPVQSAVTQWQALRAQRDAGADPVAQRKTERAQRKAQPVQAYTVQRLVQDYITGHLRTSRAPAGVVAAERALAAALHDPAFAGLPASAVTRGVAFAVIDAKKATPTAAQKLRSLLGAAWDYALDAGRLDGDTPNWWRAVLQGKLKSKGKIVGGEHVGPQRRVLRPEEVGQLLAWLPNMHPLGRDVTVLYLWTCARGVEIVGMRPEHLQLEAGVLWWTVPRAQTKNARFAHAVDLRVPLLGLARELVQQRLASVGKAGWLFEDVRGEQYTQHDYSTYIYHLQPHSAKAKRRQGQGLVLPVAGWTPHDLRRTGRTALAALGCPEAVGEAIIGHLPKGIVGVYDRHSYDAERLLWLGQLADHWAALLALPARP